MKLWLLWKAGLFLCGLLVILVFCNNFKRKHPEIQFNPKSVDLGICYGDAAKKIFSVKYKNEFKKPITIIKILKSCGCVNVSISKKILQPGEVGILSGEIEVPAGRRTFGVEIALEADVDNGAVYEIHVGGYSSGFVRQIPPVTVVDTSVGEVVHNDTVALFLDETKNHWKVIPMAANGVVFKKLSEKTLDSNGGEMVEQLWGITVDSSKFFLDYLNAGNIEFSIDNMQGFKSVITHSILYVNEHNGISINPSAISFLGDQVEQDVFIVSKNKGLIVTDVGSDLIGVKVVDNLVNNKCYRIKVVVKDRSQVQGGNVYFMANGMKYLIPITFL